MKWDIHELHAGLGAFKERWDSLNERLWCGNPYFDSRFVEPLLLHFGSGKELLCVGRVGDDESMFIAVPRGLGRWALFMPPQAQIAPLLVRDASAIRGALARLGWNALMIDLLGQDPEYSPVAALAGDAAAVSSPHARTIKVQVEGTFDEYWKGRSASVRQNVGRRLRRLTEQGVAVRLEIVDDIGDMDRVVAEFGDLESRGWKGAAGTAVSADSPQGRFYSDVMKGFAARSGASAYILYFGDRIVGIRLSILSSSMLVNLKTTYDEELSEFSPGRLLLYLSLKSEFERRRVKVIEFYTNADANQLAWGTEDRWITNVMMFRSGVVARAYQVAQGFRRGRLRPKGAPIVPGAGD